MKRKQQKSSQLAVQEATLFVTHSKEKIIAQVSLDGTAEKIFCGSPGNKGSTDGKGSAATFHGLRGITSSPDGTLFVGEFDNRTVRKITLDGTVTTLCGSPG